MLLQSICGAYLQREGQFVRTNVSKEQTLCDLHRSSLPKNLLRTVNNQGIFEIYFVTPTVDLCQLYSSDPGSDGWHCYPSPVLTVICVLRDTTWDTLEWVVMVSCYEYLRQGGPQTTPTNQTPSIYIQAQGAKPCLGTCLRNHPSLPPCVLSCC